MSIKVCIAGAGTYGSYLANIIIQKYPNAKIILIDVGGSNIKTEEEIGYYSEIVSAQYNATKKGRYFGLGGTSSMWGGQLLFFSDYDCPNDKTIQYIRTLNIKYSNKVLSRFFEKIPELKEYTIDNGLNIKQGIWLQLNKRNLFNYFNLSQKKIDIIKHYRVKSINKKENKVTSLIIQNSKGDLKEVDADIFFITCGAIETMRILSDSDLLKLDSETKGFCDHVSTRVFRLKSKPILKGQDFSYWFYNKSLVTTRIVGEYNGVSFYIQPVFNENFSFFQFLKRLIFKQEFSFKQFVKAFSQSIHLIPFIYSYLFKKKLYVYGTWDLNIDVELSNTANVLYSSDNKDKYGVQSICVKYEISESTYEVVDYARSVVRKILEEENIVFEELVKKTSTLKLEDTYHPFKLYNNNLDFFKNYNPVSNLFVCHTGLLNRAGGLNPTAVLFCLLEEIVEKNFNFQENG